MKFLIDQNIPYIKGVLEPYAEVKYICGSQFSQEAIADAKALIIRTRTNCCCELLEGSAVEMIATATIGFDHIDIEHCRQKGIEVATAAGSNARAVLQWFGAAVVEASQRQKWQPEKRKLGVVGVGNVGTLIAQYAQQWGFELLCCDPQRERKGELTPSGDKFVPLERIIAECDIITFHVPLIRNGIDKTLYMADQSFFDILPDSALIINSSRGEVVDNSALSNYCNQRRGSAIIDTWEGEPNLNKELLSEALIATPHIAGYSAQGKANAASMAIRAIAQHFALPLTNWYPSEVAPIAPRPISWSELCSSICQHYNILADDKLLRTDPTNFEALRNNYFYRSQYF